MTQDALIKAVARRLKHLGLPPALLDIPEFRDNFLFRGWVMFVRNGDQAADVHLVQPKQTRDKSVHVAAVARQADKRDG